jgi:zinc-ribbon domain
VVNCPQCNTPIPAGAKFCPQCGTAAPPPATGGINTGGGGYVGGSLNVGGSYAGRDLTVQGNYEQGIPAAELASLFAVVYRQIDAHKSDADADAEVLAEATGKVQQEVAKGEQADTGNVKRWIATIKKLAPDVAEILVNALINPGAAVGSVVRHALAGFGGG